MTLVGNVGEVPRVSERDGEAFVANFPLATNEVWRDKEGEEVRRTEWQQTVALYVTIMPPMCLFNRNESRFINSDIKHRYSMYYTP